MLKISRKFAKAVETGTFFAVNGWNFHTQTIRSLHEAVRYAEDGENFNVDITPENGFKWDEYINAFMLGIRQYVLKDDLSSLPAAKVKMNRFYWISKALQLIGLYLVLRWIMF